MVVAATWRAALTRSVPECSTANLAPACPRHTEDVMGRVRDLAADELDVEVLVFPVDFLPELVEVVDTHAAGWMGP